MRLHASCGRFVIDASSLSMRVHYARFVDVFESSDSLLVKQ